MSIRQKAILIIALSLVCLISILIVIATVIMNRNTLAAERQDTLNNLARAKNAFSFEISRLHALAWDYATRDATSDFLASPGQGFIKSNPGDTAFENPSINFIFIQRSNGEVMLSKFFDTAAKKPLETPQHILEHVKTGKLLIARPDGSIRGFLALGDSALLIAALPILPSSGTGAVRGTLIMGRFIDKHLVEQLNGLMQLSFQVALFASAANLGVSQQIASLLQTDNATFIKAAQEEILYGFGRINDVYGRPALYIRVDLPSHSYQRGSMGRLSMIATIIIICSVFGFIAYLALQRITKSQSELQESELRFRSIAESTPDAILLTDNNGTIIFWSTGAEKMFGYKKDEILGKPSFIILSEKLREREKTNLDDFHKKRTVSTTGRIFEIACLRKDGTEFPAEATFAVWDQTGKTFFSTMLRDVTERKRSEEERSLLTTAVEQSDELIVITDNTARIQYVNPSFERTTGYTRSEVIGKNPNILKSGKQTEDFYRELWQTITHDRVWKGSFVNKRKDGSLYNEAAVITPLKDDAGHTKHYVSVKRDVTQEQKLERQVRQSQKMEAIGTLAGGIAHDFNNILTAIIGFSELSINLAEKDTRLAYNLKNIIAAGFRAKALIDQILTFSRHTEQEMKPMSLAPLVKETVKFLRASLPSTIEIVQNITISNDIVLGDPTQVHQVLMNLCTNAAHAMKSRGGMLTVTLAPEMIREGALPPYPNLWPGAYARLSVSDTGHGIDPDIIDNIFEPYFTTKGKSEGTGLGLAVVHGIVKNCKGAITVKSESGSGTTFDIFLPILQAPLASQELTAETSPEGCENILLVDDEEWVRDVAGRTLTNLGYSTTTEAVPEKALELFRSAPDSFDMVITDKTMPHMTGFDLAAQIRTIRRDIPIILCSGFIERSDKELADNIGIREIIKKPFTRNQIAAAIRKVFEKSQTQ